MTKDTRVVRLCVLSTSIHSNELVIRWFLIGGQNRSVLEKFVFLDRHQSGVAEGRETKLGVVPKIIVPAYRKTIKPAD